MFLHPRRRPGFSPFEDFCLSMNAPFHPTPQELKPQPEQPAVAPPTIHIPADLGSDYRERLLGLKHAVIAEQTKHSYIDVGDGTLIHLQDSRSMREAISDGSLAAQLADLAKRCEYPVLLIVGRLFERPPVDVGRSRSIAGFLTHLELFTRIRTLQAPDRFHAVMMIQLAAKQTQRGFHSFGLEEL